MSSASIVTAVSESAARRVYLTSRTVLLVAAVLALVTVVFTVDPYRRIDQSLLAWLTIPVGWVVASLLYLLATGRLRDRPGDAWIAAAFAGIVIAVIYPDSFTAPSPVLLAATVVGSLAPWFAIAYPPSRWRTIFVGANVVVIGLAWTIVRSVGLPPWLAVFSPVDPDEMPEWLVTTPVDWPWKLVAGPIRFGSFAGPSDCCASVYSPLYAVVPAALLGLFVWYHGRRRAERAYAWHGPGGRATRRG